MLDIHINASGNGLYPILLLLLVATPQRSRKFIYRILRKRLPSKK